MSHIEAHLTYVNTDTEAEDHALRTPREYVSKNRWLVAYLKDEDGKEMGPPDDVEAREDGVAPAVPVLGHLQASNTE